MAFAFCFSCYSIACGIVHTFVYFTPNAYQLPFNCYIIFLQPDKFLFAYELNYLVISVSSILTGVVIFSYVPIIFVLMDHSCWLIDMASLTAESLSEDLRLDEGSHNPEQKAKINDSLEKFVGCCEKFVEWQSEVQDLLFWYFNLEFQVQALILCLSVYALSTTFGIILVLFSFSVIQIFVLCWMGTRVKSRTDRLSMQITKEWYLLPPPQRKVIQMILHWIQNMRGFSGLFKEVSLETCKAVTKNIPLNK